ncbi:hypothetical protein LCGC14_1071810 [marine sediment metagenome]|uniref:Uncharacterized protein n=1 Tax=marine sediment metagenome TaxID=412755 RepID=A0A0F9Q158_9ZZZZ
MSKEEIKKEGEIKCNECRLVSIPDRSQWGSEPDLCDECLKKGWIPMSQKEAQDILKTDIELNSKLYKLSPFYKI